MKITGKMTDKGFEREIDFRGSKLPDGRSIEGILNENEKLKKDISNLKKSSSILSKIIPWKTARDVIEILLLFFGIIGIVQILAILL